MKYFDTPELRSSGKIAVDTWSEDYKLPGMVPSRSQLESMGMGELRKQRLEVVEHDVSPNLKRIKRLTFCFAGGLKSPPLGTYPGLPEKSTDLRGF